MADLTPDQREAERARLQTMLDASRGQPGYADRVKAIEAALAALDA